MKSSLCSASSANPAAIRESVPLRTLHVCTTAAGRITNPDYLRMAERHRKLLALTGAWAPLSAEGCDPVRHRGPVLK